jgi:hypothetical protein
MAKFTCKQCLRSFNTQKGLNIHTTRLGHFWSPSHVETPLPKPEMEHVNYRDLVKNTYETWGQDMTKEKKKHPERDQLKLGALLEIIYLLHELIAEVKRPR